jgi:hypothetical protein
MEGKCTSLLSGVRRAYERGDKKGKLRGEFSGKSVVQARESMKAEELEVESLKPSVPVHPWEVFYPRGMHA